MTALETSLADEINEKKKEYAIEQAQRDKAVATFSVIIDTARSIMQVWSDATAGGVFGKSIWTGIVAGAGIAQLAAINSAPLPSYEVGTINVPTDRVAQLHQGETVLTKGITQEAREQGITIQPIGKGASGMVPFVILLDGREIARTMIDNINTGSVGTIKARVVK